MGRMTLGVVPDRSRDPPRGPGWVGNGRSGTDGGTLPEVRDRLETLLEVRTESGGTTRGLGLAEGISWRSGTGRGTV